MKVEVGRVKETQVHLDAFNLYFSMKASRSYKAVAEQIGVSVRNVEKWGKEFNWQQRVAELEQKIAAEVEKRLIEEEIDTRVNFNNAINESIDIYRKMINGKDSLNEETTKVLSSLVNSYCKLEEIGVKGQVETVNSQPDGVNESANDNDKDKLEVEITIVKAGGDYED